MPTFDNQALLQYQNSVRESFDARAGAAYKTKILAQGGVALSTTGLAQQMVRSASVWSECHSVNALLV